MYSETVGACRAFNACKRVCSATILASPTSERRDVHSMYMLPSFSVAWKNPNLSREDIDWWKWTDLDKRPTVMVQSPSLSRLIPTVASEIAIDRPDPRFNEASTIVAKVGWSSRPRSSMDSGFWFSVIDRVHPRHRA